MGGRSVDSEVARRVGPEALRHAAWVLKGIVYQVIILQWKLWIGGTMVELWGKDYIT